MQNTVSPTRYAIIDGNASDQGGALAAIMPKAIAEAVKEKSAHREARTEILPLPVEVKRVPILLVLAASSPTTDEEINAGAESINSRPKRTGVKT